MIRRIGQLLVMLALLAPACSDATAPPEPGVLVVRLTTPNTGDAAAVLTLTTPSGVAIEEVIASSDDFALYHRISGTAIRIAVFGTLTSGSLARFYVPNVRDASRYSVQLVEVADESNALRSSLAGYSVMVMRE